jgi:hypothetical protein
LVALIEAVVIEAAVSAVVLTADTVSAPPIDTLPLGNTVSCGWLPATRLTGVALIAPRFTAPVPLESAVMADCTAP